jgi:hypothetical protein
MYIRPNSPADKVVKGTKAVGNAVKHNVRRATAGGVAGGITGIIGSTGAFLDQGMGSAAVNAAMKTLPGAGPSALTGGAIGAGLAVGIPMAHAIYKGVKKHHALRKEQFGK